MLDRKIGSDGKTAYFPMSTRFFITAQKERKIMLVFRRIAMTVVASVLVLGVASVSYTHLIGRASLSGGRHAGR